MVNMEAGSFKAQLKRADRSGAPLAVIIGDDEAAKCVAAVKWLRREAAQVEWAWNELPRRLAAELRPGEKMGNGDGG
jgi:histidyl-tRNA synthetase